MASPIKILCMIHTDWCSLSEMAPYLRHIESTNEQVLDALGEKNQNELSAMDEKLKDAEENLGESEISELWRSKAMYLCRIGDKVSCNHPPDRS